MITKRYYSMRNREHEKNRYDINMLAKLFKATYDILNQESYFCEAIGFECVDDGFISGFIGHDVNIYILKKLRKDNLWPIGRYYLKYTEEDTFDLIELLYDIVSKPIDGRYHSYANCGMHYDTFDKSLGQQRFRQEINEILIDYGDGWELSEQGEILQLGDVGLNNIFKADIPNVDQDNITRKINHAINKFRRHKSSMVERNEAVRELADVLEFIRPQVKEELLTNDEKDLFKIANQFGIRHHNSKQQKEYDSAVWLSWIFYIYLSTIHLVIRLLNKDNF